MTSGEKLFTTAIDSEYDELNYSYRKGRVPFKNEVKSNLFNSNDSLTGNSTQLDENEENYLFFMNSGKKTKIIEHLKGNVEKRIYLYKRFSKIYFESKIIPKSRPQIRHNNISSNVNGNFCYSQM
jgi:hypothetical protein